MDNRLVKLELIPLQLPLRKTLPKSYSHNLLLQATLSDGTVGFGEGVLSPEMAGETIKRIWSHFEETFLPHLQGWQPKRFVDVLEPLEALPFTNVYNEKLHTARCALESALLDAYGKYFQHDLSSIGGWFGFAPFSRKPSIETVRVCGLLFSTEPNELKKRFRWCRRQGLREFKLLLGGSHDQENLDYLHWELDELSPQNSRCLGVDARGRWDIDTAIDMAQQFSSMNVMFLEQPIDRADSTHWPVMSDLAQVPLMADESLLDLEDGLFLAQNDFVDLFNVQISKCGGLLPSLHLMKLACKMSRQVMLGAPLGETAILAAVGTKLLQLVPDIQLTEIGYGSYHLQKSLCRKGGRFLHNGKIPGNTQPGLGVTPDPQKIERFLQDSTLQIDLTDL
jgi:muconate cycloisomerase